jgi:hypothetical protein
MNWWKAAGALLLALAVVVGLPVVGHRLRRPAGPTCALDGVAIDPRYRVEVGDGRGAEHAFCCPRCAVLWLRRQPESGYTVSVTDEVSGERIDAATAWFVRSPVVTSPATGNRLHAFRRRADAEEHARTFGGAVLSESERPFR